MHENELKKRLEQALRSVYDEDGFVYGTIICAKTPSNWEIMLDYISKAEELGEEVTHDDLVALSLILKKRDGRPQDARKTSKALK